MQVGGTTFKAGYVTRQINIQGQPLIEIENRLGFHKGRLSRGAYFLVAMELPNVDKGFSFAGYSQVADHRTTEVYGDINNPNDPNLEGKKKLASDQWSLQGSNRLVKVIAVIDHDNDMNPDQQYCPGSGIQQWKLTKTVKFFIESFVSNYPNGRFIPNEGYQPVKYF